MFDWDSRVILELGGGGGGGGDLGIGWLGLVRFEWKQVVAPVEFER